jgi:hypothetical protein
MRSLIICTVFVVFFPISIFSQELIKQDSSLVNSNILWVGIDIPKLGVAPNVKNSNDFDITFGVNVSLNFIDKKYFYHRMVFSYTEDLAIFANFPQVLMEANYLTGKLIISKNFNTRISLGLGLIKGVKRGAYNGYSGVGFNFSFSSSYQKIPFTGIGVPIEIMTTFGSTQEIGLGISANINPYISYVMMNLSIQIGKKIRKNTSTTNDD